jgi:UDPglucose 6-dehydrogenase
MNVAVVGAGRVGLIAAAGLADFGMRVQCVDIDESKITALTRGSVPFHEPGLMELLDKNRKADRLHFSTDLAEAVEKCLVLFIAVGTEEVAPGKANLAPLFAVTRAIAKSLGEYRVLVIKSTVPVGTAKAVLAELGKLTPIVCDVVSNPEFLREGSAIENFLRPDRIILGGNSEQALAVVRDIYRPLYLIETPIFTTDHETAELIKYATNAYLALKITFINEIANLCDAIGSDVHTVAKALGSDKRIGPKFLHPGPGFGGSCLPKDTRVLVNTGKQYGVNLCTVAAALETNYFQCRDVLNKLKNVLGSLEGRMICVLGLAYKPSTDDVRESRAMDFVRLLLEEGATVQAHDPAANAGAAAILQHERLNFFNDPYEAASGADALTVLTEWNEFRALGPAMLKRAMRGVVLYDVRNVFVPEAIAAAGLVYLGRGRGSKLSASVPEISNAVASR